MTRFDPCLIVTRLVILRDQAVVFDEDFHEGVNIIRGENSSGKSTVLNFLFYGLGGDLTDWSEAAKLCTRVFVEASLNGMPATFSREISVERGRPMDIFGGSYEVARVAALGQWIRYRYARSAQVESFSQAIFRLLGLPEVAAEVSGNVTIHQVLRLLYADQLSPVESLFKFERFDPPNLRDAIGRLLCGAYESDVYSNELKIRALQKESDGLATELRSLLAVLGEAQQRVSLEWVYEQQKSLEIEQSELRRRTQEVEKQVYESSSADKLTLKIQEAAYEKLQEIQGKLGDARKAFDEIDLEIADSNAFVRSLERKLESLKDSESIAEHVGGVTFDSCPACYAAVEITENSVSKECHLCKAPLHAEKVHQRIVAIINDTALQLRQSRTLQGARESQRSGLAKQVEDLTKEWRRVSQRLSEAQSLPSSEIRETLRELHRRAGYIDRQLEDQKEKARLVVLFTEKSAKRTKIDLEIDRLAADNAILRKKQENQLQLAYSAIAAEIRMLLRNDLRRQDTFETAESIEFDFSANQISVDGETYFSASSRVILKSSFFIGFLAAAASNQFFRHPRFCIVDTIEDKGMEQARSHNFQRLIVQRSGRLPAQHQIIFATAMIAPELDVPEFTVGKYSTRDSPTLEISGVHLSKTLALAGTPSG